jgi:AcrR family transcriptional regulator
LPRTRTDIQRDEKVSEIVDAARRRLHEGGYDALSLAAIARELGVAQNAIYWYFPSKDHLFVAALERTLADIAARKPRDADVLERTLWFTDQFAELFDLRGAMEEQARRSEVVAEFLANVNAMLDRMLSNVFRPHVPPDELQMAVEAFRATTQGAYVQGLDRAARRRLLTYALERLMRPAA